MLNLILQLISNVYYFALHVTGAGSFPAPLSDKRETELLVKAQKGDLSARNTLIEHNLRLVAHIVKKYYTAARDQEDLVSVGTVGLIKAIDSFDISKGARFATYAGKCLQNEILMYFRSRKKLSNEVSINDTIDVDRDGNPLTYIDVISCDESLESDIQRKINTAKVVKLISTVLSPRERKIIHMRYGTGGIKALTQKQVAEHLGISRSYVSRLEKTAIEKLRAHF